MDINKVYANVKLAVPEATLIEMNKYLLGLLDEINANGTEGIRSYTVVSGTGTYGTPQQRVDGQSFNYYPDVKCFIIPSDVTLVEKVFLADQQLSEMSVSEYLSTTQPEYSYHITYTGEMYLSFDLEDGDIINVLGKFGGMTVDILNDRYIPYFSNSIIAGLTSNEYKDADAYAIYSRRARDSKVVTVQSIVQPKLMKRNGRLY
jgi:hypothetical protein